MSEYTFSVMVLGDRGTGKTSLALRWADGIYPYTPISDLGLDYRAKRFDIDGSTVTTRVYDRRYLDGEFYNYADIKASHGIILTVDLTSRVSFDNLDRQLNFIRRHISENVPILLVGTKSDLKHVVQRSEIQAWAELHRDHSVSGYVETSALYATNVDSCFQQLSRTLFDQSVRAQRVLDERHDVDLLSRMQSSDPARASLIKKLDKYISRIDGYKRPPEKQDMPNFTSGFWFFSETRASSRAANYWFAIRLRKELIKQDSHPIYEIFSDENIRRLRCEEIESNGLLRQRRYPNPEINSGELKGIIRDAQQTPSAHTLSR